MRDSREDWRRKLDHAVATGRCPECEEKLIESSSLTGKRLTCPFPACGYETVTVLLKPKLLQPV